MSSYDGEADDPPPPAAKPAPAEPEPDPEPMKQEPVLDQTPMDAGDEWMNVQTETPQQPGNDSHGAQGFQQDHGDDYDRPISIKEDGYV